MKRFVAFVLAALFVFMVALATLDIVKSKPYEQPRQRPIPIVYDVTAQ